MAMSLSTGLFYAVSALYFTRTLGLSATTVGLGLTVAGACGVVASYAAGWASDRVPADLIQRWAMVGQGLALLAYVFADGTALVRRGRLLRGRAAGRGRLVPAGHDRPVVHRTRTGSPPAPGSGW